MIDTYRLHQIMMIDRLHPGFEDQYLSVQVTKLASFQLEIIFVQER